VAYAPIAQAAASTHSTGEALCGLAAKLEASRGFFSSSLMMTLVPDAAAIPAIARDTRAPLGSAMQAQFSGLIDATGAYWVLDKITDKDGSAFSPGPEMGLAMACLFAGMC
jgi:hypothetical protein